jgi:tetratricopeptide (TPR) repeat protein
MEKAESYMEKTEYFRALDKYSRAIGDSEHLQKRVGVNKEAWSNALVNLMLAKTGKAEAHEHLANDFMAKKDYGSAVAEYNQAYDLCPNNPDIKKNLEEAGKLATKDTLHRGDEFKRKKEYASAKTKYDEAIKLAPHYGHAYYRRATSYLEQGSWDSAISDYNKTIELAPEEDDVYYWRGLAYYKKGNLNKAIENYEQALKFDPNNTLIKKDLEEAKNRRGH